MIEAKIKLEEYRELKPYWCKRFCRVQFRPDSIKLFPDTITFKNGYSKNARQLVVECKGITVGKAKPEWSDNWTGEVFVIKLGEILK